MKVKRQKAAGKKKFITGTFPVTREKKEKSKVGDQRYEQNGGSETGFDKKQTQKRFGHQF